MQAKFYLSISMLPIKMTELFTYESAVLLSVKVLIPNLSWIIVYYLCVLQSVYMRGTDTDINVKNIQINTVDDYFA